VYGRYWNIWRILTGMTNTGSMACMADTGWYGRFWQAWPILSGIADTDTGMYGGNWQV